MIYYKSESIKDYVRHSVFKVLEDGKIARFYDKAEGNIELNLKNTTPIYETFEKGKLRNHLRNGKWLYIGTDFDFPRPNQGYQTCDPTCHKTVYLESIYQNGVKEGTWNYYNVPRDTTWDRRGTATIKNSKRKGKHLLMQEVYKDGKRLSRKRFADPWDSIVHRNTILPKVFLNHISASNNAEKFTVLAYPYLNLREKPFMTAR